MSEIIGQYADYITWSDLVAFSPASMVSTSTSNGWLVSVYLSKSTGYKCKAFKMGSVADPACDGMVVEVTRDDGASFSLETYGQDIAEIAKNIREYKWHDSQSKPSPSMVEYILKCKYGESFQEINTQGA